LTFNKELETYIIDFISDNVLKLKLEDFSKVIMALKGSGKYETQLSELSEKLLNDEFLLNNPALLKEYLHILN